MTWIFSANAIISSASWSEIVPGRSYMLMLRFFRKRSNNSIKLESTPTVNLSDWVTPEMVLIPEGSVSRGGEGRSSRLECRIIGEVKPPSGA